MAEILLMKSLKALLSFFCYFGTGIVAMDAFVGQTLEDVAKQISISPAAREITFALFMILWVLKIAWFLYEKFYLERKERLLEMDRTKKEMKEGHEKEG